LDGKDILERKLKQFNLRVTKENVEIIKDLF